jgi:transposase
MKPRTLETLTKREWFAGSMAKQLVTEPLWEVVAPVLPPPPSHAKGGRPRVPDRAALTGIVFVLKTGIPWEDLPQELGCGCGMTCWRRLHEWQAAGVWDQVLSLVLDALEEADRLDLSRASLDSSTVRAKGGGGKTGPNPTDRGRKESNQHLLTDRQGIPLVAKLSAANLNEGTLLPEMVDAVPPGTGPATSPRRPAKLPADKGYDSRTNRTALLARHIQPRLARKGIDPSSRLGRYRYVVERSFAWLHQFRRLGTRYDRRADGQQAFLTLGAVLIACNFLPRFR